MTTKVALPRTTMPTTSPGIAIRVGERAVPVPVGILLHLLPLKETSK